MSHGEAGVLLVIVVVITIAALSGFCAWLAREHARAGALLADGVVRG